MADDHAGVSKEHGPGGNTPMHEFQMPLAPRLMSLIAALLIAALSLVVAAFAIALLISQNWAVGIFLAIIAAGMIELTRYVLRDLGGKWALRVNFNADMLDLFLPANRSLIHATQRQQLSVSYSDIAAIETRLEAYTSFGMVNMQRAYVLRNAGGDHVYLFEERALGTGMQTDYFSNVVGEIARRSGAPVEDIGMTKGDNGVLGVWGTHAAEWASPALSKSEQQKMWTRAVGTGRVAIILIVLAFAVRILFGVFG